MSGRRSVEVTIKAEGRFARAYQRDVGKTFVVTELPASQAERWATRALLLLVASGMELPDDVADGGMQAVAALGFKAFGGIDFYQIEPLLDEMFSCIKIKEPLGDRTLTEDDIQEVATRLKLRRAWWDLHTGFFLNAAP